MTRMLKSSRGLLCLLALPIFLGCDREARVSKPPEEKQKQIEQLIEALPWKYVSESIEQEKVPEVEALYSGESFRRRLPGEEKSRVRALDVAEELVNEGIAAFPQLAEHADDERVSFVFRSGMSPDGFPRSVGAVCTAIVAHQVDVWQDCVDELYGSPQGQRWYPLGIPRKQFKQWMRDRDGKSLRELQLEAAERGLEWIKAAEGKTFPDQPLERTEPIRVKGQKDVEKLVERLKAGETATRERSVSDSYGKTPNR